jgi:hypothetical protein
MAEAQLYLLNPHHKDFVEGTSSKLGSAERAHYAHTFYMGPPTLLGLLLMIGVLVYLLVSGWNEEQLQQRLVLEGVSTEAQVLELRDDGGGLRPFHMTYRFTYQPPGGGDQVVRISEQAISESDFEELEPGDTVTVFYLLDNPTVSRFASELDTPLWICAPYLVVLALGLFAMRWFRSLEHWRRLRRLEQEGRLLDGEVVSSRKGIALPKDRVQVWLTYRFQAPTGADIEDTDEGGMEDKDSLPEPGTPVKVLYVDDSLYRVM